MHKDKIYHVQAFYKFKFRISYYKLILIKLLNAHIKILIRAIKFDIVL